MPAAPSGTKWEDFCNHYSIDPAEKDVLEFLRRVHPCEGTNELIILGLAFGMVKKGQCIRIPFIPSLHKANHMRQPAGCERFRQSGVLKRA